MLRNAARLTALAAWLGAPPLLANNAADALGQATGSEVTVRLMSGKEYAEATLVRLELDGPTGEVRRLRLKLASGKSRTIGIAAVAAVTADGKTLYAAGPTEKQPDKRMTRAERQAAAEQELQKQQQEERRKWLARLKARGVKPWPVESEAKHQAAIDRAKQKIEEAQELFPGLRLYETEQFLFTTNIPPQQVAPYVRYLDEMHAWMCKTYGIEPGERVWLGKASVFAFLEKQQFLAFEQHFYQSNPVGAYGICHQSSNGDVLMACYRGNDPDDFGQMLVHETSHGFVHRYKTKARLPSWMSEGMAEFIGATLVPGSGAVERKERSAVSRLRQTASLGGEFFSPSKKIDSWQYGAASNLTRYMLSIDQPAYVKLVELIKEGMPFAEALEKSYRVTPEQLAGYYGRSIGVPNLRP